MGCRGFALVLMVCLSLSITGPGGGGPYATFEHAGRTYAVSEAYAEGPWEASATYCAGMGPGWRLPTLGEALAMRDGYTGRDPLDVAGPAWCMPGFRAVWTATGCGGGAYFVYPRSTLIDDSGCPLLDCDNGRHVCCVAMNGYQPYHLCPVARCVRPWGAGGVRVWLPVILNDK